VAQREESDDWTGNFVTDGQQVKRYTTLMEMDTNLMLFLARKPLQF
jgi:hypothetical protein